MTPEERARALYENLKGIDRHVWPYPLAAGDDINAIAEAIRIAIAEEREAILALAQSLRCTREPCYTGHRCEMCQLTESITARATPPASPQS